MRLLVTRRWWLRFTAAVVLFCVASAANAQPAADGFNPSSNGILDALSQPDGKILVGGRSHAEIGRLNADGSGITGSISSWSSSAPQSAPTPSIAGRVTAADTGTGLAGVTLQVFAPNGSSTPVVTALTDATGAYAVAALSSGTYRVRTRVPSTMNYVDEAFDNVICLFSCLGTPIVVTTGATRSGVDFALAPGGIISGTLTDATTGAYPGGSQINIYTADGAFAKSTLTSGGFTGAAFTIRGLPPGTYFAYTDFFDFVNYINEAYDDIQCENICPLTTGTPIIVTIGATRSGVNFAVARGGTISGTVSNAVTGAPLSGIVVRSFTSTGVQGRTALTNSSGAFTLNGLLPGTHYVRTAVSTSQKFIDQIYAGILCSSSSCNVTSGTPVNVTGTANITNINFALAPLGTALPTITTQPVSQTVPLGHPASFGILAGGPLPVTYQWQTSSNSGASWTDITSAAPYGGAKAATLTIANASTNLNGAQYRCVATSSAGSTVSNPATLTVATPATMSVDTTALVFRAVTSGAAFTSQTSAQTVRLTQTGSGTVTWTATSTTPWLTVSPTSGSGSATLTVSTQFAFGLTASQTGSVTLTFTGAGNTAGPIGVTLHTTSAGAAPTGSFDTPIDGTTGVTGSIAVTGWAIDDIEVTGVRILRDPVAGEPAGTLVLIGHAVLVDGARPDIQALFPTSPRNTHAGWGYLMLTNFLPNLGNGTFRLTAIADDADGHSTTLGTKTITCSNSTATTPTGAIDTPAQGGTVSGNVTNFGWVLSPSPYRADPPGGGTVRVVIDGAFISAVPSGWTSRADLTALFPASQFPGIVNALGVAAFDSTALANGVHTISWVVTDNVGSASGIGSRYFTVSNGNLFLDPAQAAVMASHDATVVPAAVPAAWEVDAAPSPFASVKGRRGFNLETPLQPYAVRSGRATVQAEELDRIELHLEGIEGSAGRVASTVTGHLVVAGGLAPLPIGSALNASTGVFTWAPGVGFVGTYELVFVQWTGGQPMARQDVRIVLNPRGSNRVGPQTVIDSPSTARRTAVVGPSFVLAGWAADLDATVDRGIDTVHVWAYPATGDDPIWIGAATYGGSRPDVAAVHGNRFLTTGYDITVRSLDPGTYDLAVFGYSTVRRGFVPAKTVRVTVR